MSQKLWLLTRALRRSSVRRSVFICARRSVTPGHLVSSISFWASGSNVNAANTMNFDAERTCNAQLVARDGGLVVEDLLLGVRRYGSVHLLLHCLPRDVKGIERRLALRRPIVGQVERHFPFLEHRAFLRTVDIGQGL